MNNTFGKFFTVTTFGESHGKSIGAIVDGVPSNLPLCEDDIQPLLNMRKPGGKFTSPRGEQDKVEILSGVFNGKTLGTPIALIIQNKDCKSQDYSNIKNVFRPNHGDLTWQHKFGIRDYRGGGRSSARETATRVAAGAIALKLLKQHNISIHSALIQIGDVKATLWDSDYIYKNPFFSPDAKIVNKWENIIENLKKEGDSIGAKIEVRASNVPIGLGEPVANKLDAELAKAIMSIPAVKSVEIGIGADAVYTKGSECNDEIEYKNNKISFKSNNSGGIQAGISNGNDIIIRFVVKPTSSIQKPKSSITENLEETTVQTIGRHDPCVGIRAVPIATSMVALTLADFLLIHRSRNNFI